VSLDHLWAGWRASYIASVTEPANTEGQEVACSDDGAAGTAGAHAPTARGAEAECVFCRILASAEPDPVRHVVFQGELSVAVLNAYPYASGHLLVMPTRHVGEIEALGAEESADLWRTARDAVVAVKAAYRPDGLNMGANLGRAAGAGIPGHLHLHVVPRWLGDTNFMTSVASTRVLPEALSDSWTKLRSAWPR